MSEELIEACAFAIYHQFIAGGVGTCRYKRDEEGKLINGRDGKPMIETPDEAAMRRWAECPELTRSRFRNEALAALSMAERMVA